MTNIFKRLDLIGTVHKELLTKVCDIVQEARIKTIPKKKKCKKTKWLSRRPYFAWKIPWMEAHDCTGGSDQDHPQEKVMQKGKMVVWGGLTNS